MNHKDIPLPNTSRGDEIRYLEETLKVVKANTEEYSRQTAQMQEDIDDMLAHYHDNDVESLTDLNNTVTLYEHMKAALAHNMRALKKPYFGRIIFRDQSLEKQESLYIGRGGISRDTIHPIVIDWRAPVANAYYESGLGECSYTAPGGREMYIDLQLKRTYEIDDGELKDYFDSEVIANDELLTRYLAKNKQAVLGEIVATIQKEQNEIIRLTPYRNLIVQGAAGSGKTTVAMHRISYILYNYAERFKPEDFYIVGSNRILLNYITGVLPELDVHGVRQMTMGQLFARLLYEEWDEKKYRIGGTVRENIRGRLSWFMDLKDFCDRLEQSYVPNGDVYLDAEQPFSGGSKHRMLPGSAADSSADASADDSADAGDSASAAASASAGTSASGSASVYEESSGPCNRVLLLSRDSIGKYLRENPSLSLQSKIDGLNERLMTRLHNHFLEHMGKYTEDERKEILRSFRGWFGGKKMKLSIFGLYEDFLTEQRRKGIAVTSPRTVPIHSENARRVTELDVYDLAALAYLYARVQETEVIREAHHVVIDEAQDFGMMAYAALAHCLRGCTNTIMGDVSQNIHFGSGLDDWEELRSLLLKDPADSFRILKKSYRNTIEISEYALRILRHGTFSVYPTEPILRHGKPVQEIRIEPPRRNAPSSGAPAPSGEEEKRIRRHLIRRAVRVLQDWQSAGYNTLAVVCRDREKAARTAKELNEYIAVCGDDLENAVFSEGIMVLPVEYTKGLEFDAVLLLDPTGSEYPDDDGHAKLLYVAATRALHELCVIHSGSLTELITKEPCGDITEYRDNTGGSVPAFQKKTTADPTTLFFASGKSLQMPDAYDAENILKKARMESRSEKAPGSAAFKAAASGAAASGPAGSRPAPAAAGNTSRTSLSPCPHEDTSRMSQTPRPHEDTSRMSQTPCPRENTAKRTAPKSTRPRFGDTPDASLLRAPGHSRIDLSIRWTLRQPDGLCLQSRYGVLRLSPVSSRIVRVSFAKPGQLEASPHPKIAVSHVDKAWMYRETGGVLELLTDDLCLRIDRSTGAIRYMTRERRLLLSEPPKDCRQLEAAGEASLSARLCLELDKKESLTAINTSQTTGTGHAKQTAQALPCTPAGPARIPLRGSARVISQDDPSLPFPLVVSDRGYGLMAAAASPVIFCDLPAYGSYIHITKCSQMDFYFLLGDEKECLAAYGYLCGRPVQN